MEMFHDGNAKHAAEHAAVSKTAIVKQLKSSGAKAQEIVIGMSDEALDKSSNFPLFGGDVSAEWIIENVLIGHVNGHMGSIKDVIGK